MFSLVLEALPTFMYVYVREWTCTQIHTSVHAQTHAYTQSMKENNLSFHHPDYRKHKRKIQKSRVAFFISLWLKVWVDYIDKNVIRYSDYFVVTINVITITNTNTIFNNISLVSYESLVIIWKCILGFFTQIQVDLIAVVACVDFCFILIPYFSDLQFFSDSVEHFKNHFSSVFKLWIFLFIEDLFPC